MKKQMVLLLWGLLFLIGIIIVLKSNYWELGSIVSMNIAGTIISVFSGIGILMELYLNKK